MTQRKRKMKKSTVCGIVAIGPGDVIGKNGVMPWYSRKDFYHFRTLTTPFPCMFGKHTFENLPMRPLPNRLNVVLSSSYQDEFRGGIFCAKTIESAIEKCKDFPYVFICGGAKVYEYALLHDLIDIMYITKIYDNELAKNIEKNGNDYVRFPVSTNEFFASQNWVLKRMLYPEGKLPIECNDITTKFFKYVRVRG